MNVNNHIYIQTFNCNFIQITYPMMKYTVLGYVMILTTAEGLLHQL